MKKIILLFLLGACGPAIPPPEPFYKAGEVYKIRGINKTVIIKYDAYYNYNYVYVFYIDILGQIQTQEINTACLEPIPEEQ